MSNQAIISKVEAIDRVVKEFAEDIYTFKSDVGEKVNDIDSALFRLSNVWEGELHTTFEESMRIKQSEMRTALTRAGNLKEKLDEISAEMAAMLELLKSAGED